MMINKIKALVKRKGILGLLVKVGERIKYRMAARRYMFKSRLTDEEYERQSDKKDGKDTLISVCVPVFNPREEYFREMLNSVLFQSYGNWELCIADGSTSGNRTAQNIVKSSEDERISYRRLDFNMGIVGNSNEAVMMARGDYIVLLDHDDMLSLDALFEIKKAIDKDADFIYSDEVSFKGNKNNADIIHFKPDYSVFNLRGNNYICHLSCFKKSLFEQCGGFREGFDGSQDHDLILRLCENARSICHISRVLYYWREHSGSVAAGIGAKPYCIETGRQAVADHLKRMKLSARVDKAAEGAYFIAHYANSVEPTVLNNIANAAGATADYIICAADNIRLTASIINELSQYIWQDNVGIVGAMAVKNGIIYSAGLSVKGGKLKHAMRGTLRVSDGYMHILHYAHEVTAVDGYCFAIRRSALERAGGFDKTLPERERVADMCLRLRELGYSVVLNPMAAVNYRPDRHELSKSFKRRWRGVLQRPDRWLRNEII